MQKVLTIVILFGSALLSAGCGNGYVPFGGKVVYEDDGSPLKMGIVVFTTDTFQAEGPLNDKGEYQLGSLLPEDGLPPGTYKVFISGAAEYRDDGTVIPFIHTDYLERKTTPLTCEVTRSGLKSFDIRVPRP